MIPTSNPQILRSVVELEQRTISQVKALHTFKSQALVSEPTRALLDKIDAHCMGMQRMMVAVINLWCQDCLIVESLRGNLRTNLQKSIKEINDLNHALTAVPVGGILIIHAKQLSEDSSHECTV